MEHLDPRNLSSVQLVTRQGDQPEPSRVTKPVWHEHNSHYYRRPHCPCSCSSPEVFNPIITSHTSSLILFHQSVYRCKYVQMYSLHCCFETLSILHTISTPLPSPTTFSTAVLSATLCSWDIPFKLNTVWTNVKLAALRRHISKVPRSNLGPKPAILTEACHGCPQFLQTNAGYNHTIPDPLLVNAKCYHEFCRITK